MWICQKVIYLSFSFWLLIRQDYKNTALCKSNFELMSVIWLAKKEGTPHLLFFQFLDCTLIIHINHVSLPTFLHWIELSRA